MMVYDSDSTRVVMCESIYVELSKIDSGVNECYCFT